MALADVSGDHRFKKNGDKKLRVLVDESSFIVLKVDVFSEGRISDWIVQVTRFHVRMLDISHDW